MRGCMQQQMFRCSAVRAYIVLLLERNAISLSFPAAVMSMQYSVCLHGMEVFLVAPRRLDFSVGILFFLMLTRRCWDMSRLCGSSSQVLKLHTLDVRQVSLYTTASVLPASRLFMTSGVAPGTQVSCLVVIAVGDSPPPSIAL